MKYLRIAFLTAIASAASITSYAGTDYRLLVNLSNADVAHIKTIGQNIIITKQAYGANVAVAFLSIKPNELVNTISISWTSKYALLAQSSQKTNIDSSTCNYNVALGWILEYNGEFSHLNNLGANGFVTINTKDFDANYIMGMCQSVSMNGNNSPSLLGYSVVGNSEEVRFGPKEVVYVFLGTQQKSHVIHIQSGARKVSYSGPGTQTISFSRSTNSFN